MKLYIYSNDYYSAINKSQSLTLVAFIFYLATFYIHLGFSLEFWLIFLMTAITSTSIIINKRRIFSLCTFKKWAFYYLLLMMCVNCFLSLRFNNSLNIEYFFFTNITSLPIVFNTIKDKKKISILYFTIVACILLINTIKIPLIQIIKMDNYLKEVYYLKYYNIVFSLIFIALNFIYLFEKEVYINYNSNEIKKIEEQVKKKILYDNEYRKQQLIDVAKANMTLFMDKYYKLFPDFLDKVENKDQLNKMDLCLCALIKLDINNRELSEILNTSTKSIESRKYRIKKKLIIPSEKKLEDYIKQA